MNRLTDTIGISEARTQQLYDIYRSLAVKSNNTSNMIVSIESIPGLQIREKIYLGYILGRNASRFLQ